ncbi:hypothetical protein [Halarsenatibacter silvermanii]|uniref:Uncharacterized protein n=1 Tax=Halarsenatibacter silvermanii TaxID=321763 RepID=A0A1G9MBX9_9FIRM|nr:hypothetical protein [Halarsenatibacter silvermanii]SDL71633.1 hypothetical protein SAMN04488692_10817 [Halarsenatibacter silvermanii]
MSGADFTVANLTDEEMEKLKSLEEEFSGDRDRKIALVAYESEEEFSLADLSPEDEEYIRRIEEEIADKRGGDVALIVYESSS